MLRHIGRSLSQVLRSPFHERYSDITLSDFADIFSTSVDDIPEDCRELIAKTDFRYKNLTGVEREQIILRALQTIDSDSLSVVGHILDSFGKLGTAETIKKKGVSN